MALQGKGRGRGANYPPAEPPVRKRLPPHDQSLPLLPDPLDGGYTTSFEVGDPDGIRGFFEQNGFVVVRGVLDAQGCGDSRAAIMELVREGTRGAFSPNDPATWSHWPRDGIEHYGQPQTTPVFGPRFLANRQLPGLHRAHAILLGTEDLLVNHDRCCFFRPALDHPARATRTNIHLDMNPWEYLRPIEESTTTTLRSKLDYSHHSHFIQENNLPNQEEGLSLQCVLNLNDNKVEDGGFATVPGFHKQFHHFFHPENEPDAGAKDDDGAFRKMSSHSFPRKGEVGMAAGRVAMREGSIVMWDHRMAHGSFPNGSHRPRFAQFMKLFPASIVEPQRFAHRSGVLQHIITPYLLSPANTRKGGLEVGEVGRQVFGVRGWTPPPPSHPNSEAVALAIHGPDPSKPTQADPAANACAGAKGKKKKRSRLQ